MQVQTVVVGFGQAGSGGLGAAGEWKRTAQIWHQATGGVVRLAVSGDCSRRRCQETLFIATVECQRQPRPTTIVARQRRIAEPREGPGRLPPAGSLTRRTSLNEAPSGGAGTPTAARPACASKHTSAAGSTCRMPEPTAGTHGADSLAPGRVEGDSRIGRAAPRPSPVKQSPGFGRPGGARAATGSVVDSCARKRRPGRPSATRSRPAQQHRQRRPAHRAPTTIHVVHARPNY